MGADQNLSIAGAALAPQLGMIAFAGNEVKKSAEAPAKRAKEASDRLYNKELELEAQAAARTADQESDKNATQVRNLARAKQLANNNTGRSSTILTSPLGVVGDQTNTSGKTLLGM